MSLEEITKALKNHWPIVFKKEMDSETDLDPYLLCGFIHEALSEPINKYAQSKAAQAWEEACEAQRNLCAEDLPEKWLHDMVKQTVKPNNPYKK